MKAIESYSTLDKIMRAQDDLRKVMRAHETIMSVTRAQETVTSLMRAAETLNTVVRGPSMVAALNQASLTLRLNEVLASSRAAQFDGALGLTSATYADVLQTAAQRASRASVHVVEAPPKYEDYLRNAEDAVVAALDDAGFDGQAELRRVRAAAEADLADAITASEDLPYDESIDDAVDPSATELHEIQELLRELLSRPPASPSTSEARITALTIGLLIVAILTLAVAFGAWRFPVAPLTAPSTQSQTATSQPSPSPPQPAAGPAGAERRPARQDEHEHDGTRLHEPDPQRPTDHGHESKPPAH